MNLGAIPELLLTWVKTQGVALLQGDKPQAASLQPGQQYDGKVLDSLASGRYLVRVGNQMLDMNLPAKTQPGETVRLTYLNASPRPAFLLNQAAISPVQPVQISNTAQQVNALLRLAQAPSPGALPGAASSASVGAASSPIATPGVASSQATATLATSTRLPAALVETMKTPGLVATAAAPAAATGITSGAAMSTRPIVANVTVLQNYAAVLQATTATLTGLNTGLLGQAVDAPRAAIPASTTLSANTLVELPTSSRHMLPLRLSQTLNESGLFYEAHLAKWSKGALTLEAIMREPQARPAQEFNAPAKMAELGGMPEEAARLAGRQLQMLEGAPFVWQGYAWPGQWMDWLVQEQTGGGDEVAAENDASEWVTELHLTLPNMGSIHVQLGLTGERLKLRLSAAEAVSREMLCAALPQLTQSLEASGLRPVELTVEASHVVA